MLESLDSTVHNLEEVGAISTLPSSGDNTVYSFQVMGISADGLTPLSAAGKA